METPHTIIDGSEEDGSNEIEQVKQDVALDETAKAKLRREHLVELLEELRVNPAWKDADHPELANGSYEWVRQMRMGSEKRLQYLDDRRNGLFD